MRLLFSICLVFLFSSAILASDIDALITEAGQKLPQTRLLEAQFSQKTTMPFIDVPLQSEGKFCFDIRNKHEPMIFWEYQKPDISGFVYRNGKADFWTADKNKALNESEMGYLKSMTDQILQWVNFDPAKLEKTYAVSGGSKPRSIRFEPREKSRLFAAIELVLSPDKDKLDELSFHGRNGEVTTISFNVQSANKPLSGECQR